MRILVLASLVAAIALATPAEAASKKRKAMHKLKAVATQSNGYTVYDFDGRVAGRDPDPFIRAMIRKDPRPGEGEF